MEHGSVSFLSLVQHASITTHSGRRFNPFDPKPGAIVIEDIGHGLAHQNRYNGHTKHPFSVAQHSYIVARILEHWGCSPCVQLCGLLHDAPEALGLPDVPSPVKPVLQGYELLEESIARVVAEVFGLPWPYPPEVKRADVMIRSVEVRCLLSEAMQRAMPAELAADTGDGWIDTLYIDAQPAVFARETFLGVYFDIQAKRGDKMKPKIEGLSVKWEAQKKRIQEAPRKDPEGPIERDGLVSHAKHGTFTLGDEEGRKYAERVAEASAPKQCGKTAALNERVQQMRAEGKRVVQVQPDFIDVTASERDAPKQCGKTLGQTMREIADYYAYDDPRKDRLPRKRKDVIETTATERVNLGTVENPVHIGLRRDVVETSATERDAGETPAPQLPEPEGVEE